MAYEMAMRSGMRAAARGLWSGVLSEFEFFDAASLAIFRYFSAEYYKELEACGMSPADMTVDERQALTTEIYSQMNYLNKLGSSIGSHPRGDGKLNALYTRLEMWVGRLGYIRSMAKTGACSDIKYEWVYGHTKVHCGSCKRMSGRVYRGRVWRKYNIAPRARDLECGGYHCRCELIPTSRPVTPGRPPIL